MIHAVSKADCVFFDHKCVPMVSHTVPGTWVICGRYDCMASVSFESKKFHPSVLW
jgi:hypothetical protein